MARKNGQRSCISRSSPTEPLRLSSHSLTAAPNPYHPGIMAGTGSS